MRDLFQADVSMTILIDLFQALKYLNEVTCDSVLTINPTFRLPDGSGLFAQILVNGIHLNQELLDKGWAVTKPVSLLLCSLSCTVLFIQIMKLTLNPFLTGYVYRCNSIMASTIGLRL